MVYFWCLLAADSTRGASPSAPLSTNFFRKSMLTAKNKVKAFSSAHEGQVSYSFGISKQTKNKMAALGKQIQKIMTMNQDFIE